MDGLLTTFKLCIILALLSSCNSGKESKASAFLHENNRRYGYTETGDYQKAEKESRFLRNLVPTSWDTVLELARLYRDTGRVEEALDTLKPYQKVSPKGKTLEQKAVLLEMRELYQAMDKKRGCNQ